MSEFSPLEGGGAAPPLPLVAYHGSRKPDMPILPAGRTRSWIEDDARHARHCLPLMMANQTGWFILNNQGFSARWNGDACTEGVQIEYDGLRPRFFAHSAFGHGVLSFMIPYLFRTPPGINLLARGPSNWPLDGIAPLEGLIETDWAVSPFTMNWKFTRPGVELRFERGDPVCMVQPQPRDFLERFAPALRRLDSDARLREANAAFSERRHASQVLRFAAGRLPEARGPGYEGDYMRGLTPDGEKAPEHQRKLALRAFD
jgi:hypothetical protein